jgi:GNAT superfamily N-acetyltransferase
MVVDPALRSRGVGRALLAEVDRVAADAGCAFVEVTAGHHRADARRLFEAAGFDTSLTTYLRKHR